MSSTDTGSKGFTSAEEYQTLLASFAQAFWETDAQGLVTTDSLSWRAYTGQSLEEWLGEGWSKAVHPDDQEYALSQWQEAARQLRPVNAEFRLQRPGGGWRWTNMRATPILNADGSVRKWLGINIDISEEKRAEEALRDSQQRYRSLLENLPDYAIYRLDSNGNVTEWNEGAQRMKGYSAEEAVGHSAFLCYTPEALAAGEAEQELFEAAQTGRLEREAIRLRKTGERFWVNEITTAIHDAQGQLVGFTKISRDITRRKRAQALRRQLEQRTRLAVEAADMATWEWHLATDEVYWDEQHFKLLGMPFEFKPLKSEAFISRIHPEDRDSVVNELTRTITEQSLFDAEFRMIRDDQVTRWMSGYGRVTGEEEGKPTQMSGVMLDITDRKMAEEALRASEERINKLISLMPAGVYTCDAEGRITYFNRQAVELWGRKPRLKDAQDRFCGAFRLWQPDGSPLLHVKSAMAEAVEKGISFRNLEVLVEQPSGNRLIANVSIDPLFDNEGKLAGAINVFVDVTERKKAEEGLKEADRRKDEFLAMLAHELRNPMATIRSGLQILSLTGSDNQISTGDRVASTLTMMNRQTDHLIRLVDDLLDVSRISQNKIELQMQRLNLVDLVRHAADSMREMYRQQGRSLQVTIPAFPIHVKGDSTRLTQVVINLLSNGLRYTNEGGNVWLSLEQTDRKAILQVRDNGIGLAKDQLSAIFELFVQADNSLARSRGGLGLGLTLVKRLLEMHGGRVEVQSEGLGKGSTFSVYLPTLNVFQAAPLAKEKVSGPSLRLLIVDDNSDVSFTLGMILEIKGHQVHTRNSGREGVQAAESLRPDVILLDIGMPEMDGYETCRQMREQPWGKELFIIAVSGYGQEEDKQKARAAGFDDHLTKPIDIEALIQVLSRLP